MILLLCWLLGGMLWSVGRNVVWLYKHAQCYSREAGVTWHEGAAHVMTRICPRVNYETILTSTSTAINTNSKPRVCMTTLSDGGVSVDDDNNNKSWWARFMARCRDFDTVAARTWPNQQRYAQRHDYTARENSALLDPTRPPAWSKIRAVQSMLNLADPEKTQSQGEPHYHCDWVLWLDADVVIMNSSIPLESFIPVDPNIHLIVTADRRFTANSGVWLLRNSAWSRQFLQDWWELRSYVRPKGLSLSGDNDAFGHLIRQRLHLPEHDWTASQAADAAKVDPHIRMPARCNLNSFGVYVTNVLLSDPATVMKGEGGTPEKRPEWYESDLFYHAGDFIAHASGIDQKSLGVEFLLQRAT